MVRTPDVLEVRSLSALSYMIKQAQWMPLTPVVQHSYRRRYKHAPHFRAFAVSTDGQGSCYSSGRANPELALSWAIRQCERRASEWIPYAIGDELVLGFSEDRLDEVLRTYRQDR